MRTHKQLAHRRPGFQPLAIAAAVAAMLGTTLPVAAQSFSQSGANSTTGIPSGLPFVGTPASLDFGSDIVNIGNSAPGSFAAQAGAVFKGGALSIANGGIGAGTVEFTGAGTTAELRGTNNRLEVGNWGVGTLTVSNGAKLDATANAAACVGSNCFNVIGNAAGSTGTLTVSDVGSELKTLRWFVVGSAYVAPGFGTQGGTTNAFLDVLNGGTLRTEGAGLAQGPGGPNALGTEKTFATVRVDGANSRWLITHNSIDNQQAALYAGQHANGKATITVSNGGLLSVDGSATGGGARFGLGSGGQATLTVESGGKVLVAGAVDPAQTHMDIGGGGGSGTATVKDLGSELKLSGHVGNLDVGSGVGSVGSLNVLNLGRVVTGGLNVGANGGSGTMTVNNATVEINNGYNGRLIVGSSGNGSLLVSGGGVVDATLNPGACIGNWCGNIVGNGAGATGTLTIDGAGSEVRTLGSFQAGNPYVDQYTGTPGGTATATINITNGGKLVTGNTTLATTPGGPLAAGTEKSFVNVLVNGTGSQWTVKRNAIDNTAAVMSIGSGGSSDSSATVVVSGGGKLHIDGTGSSGPNDFLQIGVNGKGKVTVTGSGSSVLTTGVNTLINVGAGNSFTDGTFEILAGATVSTLYMNVGRNGGTGTMLIDGAGSKLTQYGVGTNQTAGSNGAAGTSIGRNTGGGAGTGTVTVSNGGQWLISDDGGDGRIAQNSPAVVIGRGANSTGTLTITGAGSKVEITATSLNPGAGVGDNYNPFVGIGYDNPTTTSGTLTVSSGGKLILTGNSLSTPTFSRATGLNVGGRTGAAGTGTATVNGAESEIRITGSDAYINVGRSDGSTGVLNVQNQALVTATSMSVGIGSTGAVLGPDKAQGTVNIDNAKILLSGLRTDVSPQIGAGATIGRGVNGMGALNISNGGQLEFRPTVSSAGMSIGGDQFLGGGIGTVTLSGGSSIVRSGPFSGIGINIGWTGTGTVLMTGGSYIDVGTGNLSVAGSPPVGFNSGNGNLTFNSGSKLLAGTVNIGGSGDTSSGGLGSVTLSGADSELRAMASNGFLGVGRGGGTGTLSALSGAKISTISASIGRSGGIGTLVVNNATYEATGQQTVTGGLGANLSIGLGGANGPGIGVASFVGSTISIVNDSALNADGGVATAALNLGGRKDLSGGSGTLLLSNSQLNISAPNGLADINIGHSGTGTATLNASAVNAAGGNIYVAREVGSVGTLTMVNGSTIDAGFVGIGVSAKYDGVAQANGGTGTLVLNNSTIRTAGFELGAGSVLTGDGGTIEIIPSSGDVVIGGTIAPGNSPGRLRIRCNVIMLPGSKVILEVSGNGNSLDEYGIDELIIDGNATFNLASAQIEFSFLADTNPNNFAAIGGMNLDNFFRTETGNTTAGLSTKFAAGQSWSTTVDTSSITARSESAAYSNIQINYAGNGNVNVVAVPEPSTWGMLFAGLCAVGAVARRRRVQAAQA